MGESFILTDWYYSPDNPRNDDNGDARSEARYEDAPGEEPDTAKEWPRDEPFTCIVDESAGFRG